MRIAFTVYGRPQPQGSTRAFIPKGWNRAIITSDNSELKPFRQQVSATALATMREAGAQILPRDAPVSATFKFYFKCPKSRKKSASHTVRPDVDKLSRAVFDSLTGVVFEDDSQVARLTAGKLYGLPERTEIEVESAA